MIATQPAIRSAHTNDLHVPHVGVGGEALL